MAVTVTLKPWRHLFIDIARTFTPYKEDGEEDLLEAIKGVTHEQTYRDETAHGDAAQPFRGLVNMAKGLGRIGMGIIKLFPLTFIILWYIERYSGKPLLTSTEEGTTYMPYPWWVAFKEVGKDLLYDITNGLGIFLRGALQLVTTPLTWFIRIPLRLAITEGVRNFKEYEKYNNELPKELQLYHPSNLSPFSRIARDFKGTLAPYPYSKLMESTSIGLQPFELRVRDIAGSVFLPLRGAWNIVKGLITLPFVLIRLVFCLIEVPVKYFIYDETLKEIFLGKRSSPLNEFLLGKDPLQGHSVGEWSSFCFGSLVRGVLQIVATPLEWLIRMPLRGIISYHLLHKTETVAVFHLDSKEKPKDSNTSQKNRGENLPGRNALSESFTYKPFSERTDNAGGGTPMNPDHKVEDGVPKFN